ncbi:MAG: hypothetical protein HN929_09055 [Chloroflexi bacterium]|nr:hypothetical protein [Chloroflexota bacterium]
MSRIATVPMSVASSKDAYAYTLGTFTTETLQGARVSCDTVGYNYSRPDEIVEHLLLNYGNSVVAGDLNTTVTANADFSTNYPMGFALTKQYDLSTLCRQIAYQCAARFFWDSGKAFLTKIPEGTPTADKALVADDVVYGSMSMRWTPTRDIINSLDARYDLRGREYLAVDSASDSTSITAYGTQDGSSKFKLDLVNSATTAGNVVDDYILKLKEPKRVAIFTTPLQNIELQRGDIVSITHPIDGGWTAKLFEILETSVTIGNVTTPDQITFTVEEI